MNADLQAVFAGDGPPTIAFVPPIRALPPVELMHRVGAGPEGGSQVATFDLAGRTTAAGVLRAAPTELLRPGARVLDFGCGAGRALRFLHDARPDLVLEGCEIDGRSVEWLERNLPEVSAFENKEIPPLDRPDGSYDLIYVLSVFTHLADTWSGWLTEMHRLLRPGGMLFATFLGAGPYEAYTDREYDPDRVGMAVIHLGESWDVGGPIVFHSEWWIREHWGRAFDVLEVYPQWPDLESSAMQQSAAVLRRRDVVVTSELLDEWRQPEREHLGMLNALELAHDETAMWRSHARELQRNVSRLAPRR